MLSKLAPYVCCTLGWDSRSPWEACRYSLYFVLNGNLFELSSLQLILQCRTATRPQHPTPKYPSFIGNGNGKQCPTCNINNELVTSNQEYLLDRVFNLHLQIEFYLSNSVLYRIYTIGDLGGLVRLVLRDLLFFVPKGNRAATNLAE